MLFGQASNYDLSVEVLKLFVIILLTLIKQGKIACTMRTNFRELNVTQAFMLLNCKNAKHTLFDKSGLFL